MKTALGPAVAAAALCGFGWVAAEAEGGLMLPRIENAAMLKECGACHMVYSPQLLPARSWQDMMAGLDSHFGESAKLDEAVRLEILGYLKDNAADSLAHKDYAFLSRGVGPAEVPQRITQMPWFRNAHGEANLGALAGTRVKLASNCIGCHVGADSSMLYSEPGD